METVFGKLDNDLLRNNTLIDKFDDVLKLLADKEYTLADDLLEEMLEREKDNDNREKIRSFRTFIANNILKESGFRTDVLFYLVGALAYYKNKSTDEIKKIGSFRTSCSSLHS